MANVDLNIYALCRHRAHMTQEAWAEALGISPESVKRYEGNLRVPPNAIVARMVNVSGDESLALRHILKSATELDVLPDVGHASLPKAAIQLINRVLQFADAHRDRQLLQIAEDGVISPEERPIFDTILSELQDLISVILQIRYCSDEGREC